MLRQNAFFNFRFAPILHCYILSLCCMVVYYLNGTMENDCNATSYSSVRSYTTEQVQPSGKQCIALWNFVSDDLNSVNLRKGEEVILLKEVYGHTELGDQLRWKRGFVQRKNGQRGYVAKSYLEKLEKVLQHSNVYKNTWYVGDLPVDEGELCLEGNDIPPGSFVICAPPNYPKRFGHTTYALIVKLERMIAKRHGRNSITTVYQIDRDFYGRYRIGDSEPFASLYTLVKCLNRKNNIIATNLTAGPPTSQDAVLLEVPAPPRRVVVGRQIAEDSRMLNRTEVINKYERTIRKMGKWFLGKARIEEAKQRLQHPGAKPGAFVIFAPATQYETDEPDQYSLLVRLRKGSDADSMGQYRIRRDNDGNFYINRNQKYKTLDQLVTRLRQPDNMILPVPLTQPANELKVETIRGETALEPTMIMSKVVETAKSIIAAEVPKFTAELAKAAEKAVRTELERERLTNENIDQCLSDATQGMSIPGDPLYRRQESDDQMIERIAAKVAAIVLANQAISKGKEERTQVKSAKKGRDTRTTSTSSSCTSCAENSATTTTNCSICKADTTSCSSCAADTTSSVCSECFGKTESTKTESKPVKITIQKRRIVTPQAMGGGTQPVHTIVTKEPTASYKSPKNIDPNIEFTYPIPKAEGPRSRYAQSKKKGNK